MRKKMLNIAKKGINSLSTLTVRQKSLKAAITHNFDKFNLFDELKIIELAAQIA